MSYFGLNGIGKLFLGSTEIAKAYLGTQLVYQSGSPTPGPDPGDLSNYVSSGLVLHLDGINKGATSGRWESLVGNGYYTLTANSTEETNAVVMSGSGVILGTNITAVGYAAGTIECVYEYITGTGNIIIYAASGGLALIRRPSAYIFGVTSSNNQWNVSNSPNLGVVSINTSRCVVNGVSVGTSKSNNSWGSGAATCPIGGRTSGSSRYYSNVRIFSIRKYNRLLTEAEMLQNQAVDNARFNLGLNI